MKRHADINDKSVRKQIRQGTIFLAGNSRLKIYGTLKCRSGKRMKRENRVFFESANETKAEGYRPCGHCMRGEYKEWIYSTSL